jgi:hypothetical protein
LPYRTLVYFPAILAGNRFAGQKQCLRRRHPVAPGCTWQMQTLQQRMSHKKKILYDLSRIVIGLRDASTFWIKDRRLKSEHHSTLASEFQLWQT